MEISKTGTPVRVIHVTWFKLDSKGKPYPSTPSSLLIVTTYVFCPLIVKHLPLYSINAGNSWKLERSCCCLHCKAFCTRYNLTVKLCSFPEYQYPQCLFRYDFVIKVMEFVIHCLPLEELEKMVITLAKVCTDNCL